MRKWYFPKAEKIGINGLNNIASSFLDTPLKTLAKEICQNSLDTKMSKYYKEEWSKKIKIEFNEFWVNASELDGYEELLNVIKAEYEFAKSYYVNDKSVINFYQNALNCLQQDKIRCLRISDYNTPGLTGSNLKNHSAWADLVKNIGVSDKPEGSSGSKGQGKLAAFACSSLYTVFYNTVAVDGFRAAEGVARLSGYVLENDNNYVTLGQGYYEENGEPIRTGLNMLKGFNRDSEEFGTDVIIIGFKNDYDDWKEQIIASTIDSFFVSIIKDDLEILIDETHILNANTIHNYMENEIIAKYMDPYTKKYYEVLTADEGVITVYATMFEENDITLKLKIDKNDDGLKNTVSIVRLTGMKIFDKDGLPKLGIYHGVLLLNGKQINDYFRKLENDTHDRWSAERGPNPTEARKKIDDLNKFIIKTIKENLAVQALKEIDAEGIGEFLPDEDSYNDNQENNENENIENEKVIKVEITEKPVKISKKELYDEIDKSGEDNDIELDENGEIIIRENTYKQEPKPGPNPNPIPDFYEKYSNISKKIIAKKLKVLENNKKYLLFIILNSDEPIIKLKVYIYGESNNECAIINNIRASKKSTFGRKNIECEYKGNEIILKNIEANEDYQVEIDIETDDIWPLEVKVYGNK